MENEIEIKGNGNGHKESAQLPPKMSKILNGGILDGTVGGIQSGSNALDKLTEPGEDITKLLMRTDFPDQATQLAVLFELERCQEFGYKQGLDNLLNYCAGLTAIRGKRIGQTVQAIIGDRELKEGGGGIGKWFREKAFGKGNG